MNKFAVWVFTIVPLLAAALATDLIPKHGFDLSWSGHARFHATWASAKFLALGIIVALIAQNALINSARWAWWAMLTYLLIGIGGMVPAMLWHGDGPPTRPLVMIGIMVVFMVIALLGTAKSVFSPERR
ncbi:MAG: hypothetical protein ACI8XU_002119 [Kiritimatiellia bacterium]|jgi:hypothetical protein